MKVKIELDQMGHKINFLVYSGEGQNMAVGEPMELTFRVLEEGDPIKPTFSIENQPGLLESLANELDKLGAKTDSDHKLIGTLEATKYHLEDCRKMLKLNH